MKAVVKTQRAPGAELIEVAIPQIGPEEALVKIEAVSICGTDVHIYKWDKWAEDRIKNIPQILGHEFAGKIVEVGKKVKKFKVGDYVSAETHIYCGKCIQCNNKPNNQKHLCATMKLLGVDCNGSFAEYIAVPGKILWKNDPRIPLEVASLQEPLGNAVYCALGEDRNLGNKRVLIIGDGPAGLLASGVAKVEGASKVILVGRHDARLEIGKKMGADIVINENQEKDVAKVVLEKAGRKVDIVLEMAGSKKAIEELALKLVRKGGIISAFGIPSKPISIEKWGEDLVFGGITINFINGRLIWKTWKKVADLLLTGKLDITPVITHKLPLEEFEKGFDLMTTKPKISGKVILIP